jgi:dUTPase
MYKGSAGTILGGQLIKIDIESILPIYQSGSNICNLYANLESEITLGYQQAMFIPTGVCMKQNDCKITVIGPDIQSVFGVHTLTIDHPKDYTPEISVCVLNLNRQPTTIKPLDLLGQIIVIR